jgi:hypothetical protein
MGVVSCDLNYRSCDAGQSAARDDRSMAHVDPASGEEDAEMVFGIRRKAWMCAAAIWSRKVQDVARQLRERFAANFAITLRENQWRRSTTGRASCMTAPNIAAAATACT